MRRLKLGVCLDSLGLPLRRALQETERMGVTGVQVDAAGDRNVAAGNVSPACQRIWSMP